MAKKPKTKRQSLKSEPGISIDDAVSELSTMIESAVDFQAEELEPEWALAERYYNGLTDLEEFEGRSNVTKTEVRDAIRNSLPSIMRTLLHSRKPVTYIPNSVTHAMWIDQQAEYVVSLFYKNNGYLQLYTAIHEALKLKIGPLKAFWEPDPAPEYFKYTRVPLDVVEALGDDPLIELHDLEEADTRLEDVSLYNISGYKYHENGKIVIEAVPNYEFFISQNCPTIEDAIYRGVHGQRYLVTVAEALDLGLDYDGDWLTLDAEDPELKDTVNSSTERRGYQKKEPNEVSSKDVLRHEFLLTECYAAFDLNNEGRPQLYRFYLGGTTHEYLHHEQVEDSPFSLVIPIPIPHTAYGHSMADLTIEEQDTSTSLLRAAVDNAHASNDVKIAADPTKTNFDDIMNKALNAPIRKRAGDTLQTIQIPFTGQGNLALLQYLDQDVQNKVGVTKAAQGLDPDAMQSTDKQAVLNTIMTAQGQTELMVRNIVETGLIRLFRILLRLSIRHQEPLQIMKTKGKLIPVDLRMFDPDAIAQPNVGLGTGSPLQKQAALSMIYQEQKGIMQQYGPNNPFTSFAQMYNTLEDMLEANGIYNVERYFNIVTPQVEEQWAKAQEQKQQELAKQQLENQPMDPSKAFLAVEKDKRKIDMLRVIGDQREKERSRALEAITKGEELDLKRDELTQNRVIKLREVDAKEADQQIKREQAQPNQGASRVKREGTNSNGGNVSTGPETGGEKTA